MPAKFTHQNYDGKHWIKGTAEYALDNEINRLNRQIVKFARGGATNSPSYKRLVTELEILSNGNVHFKNGIPQASRSNKVIASAVKKHGDTQFKKIAKSKSHKTWENYKKASKKIGLTPNELSYINNESAVYYEAMYMDDSEDIPMDWTPEDESLLNMSKERLEEIRNNPNRESWDTRANLPLNVKYSNTFHSNPHTFDNNVRELFIEDIIVPKNHGYYNNETGEWFDKYDDAVTSFDETAKKISSGEWNVTLGHWNDNIDWKYYNKFDKRKEW